MNKFELHDSIVKRCVITFSRSGGKGGQNVNKVNTKVHLCLAINDICGVTEEERNRIRVKLSAITNNDDCLFLDVDEQRYQERNRVIALSRLENRIIQALYIPKKRLKTRPTSASKERKLMMKKVRSAIKKNRSQNWDVD